MITGFIIKIFYYFLFAMVALLPASDGFPASFTTALQYFVNIMRQFDWLVPTTTLFQVLGLILAFEAAILAYKAVQWVIRLVRGH